MRVRTVEEARRRLDEVFAAGMSVVLQEYIPGPCPSTISSTVMSIERAESRRCSPGDACASIRPTSATAPRWSASARRCERAVDTFAGAAAVGTAASSRRNSSATRATACSSCSRSTRGLGGSWTSPYAAGLTSAAWLTTTRGGCRAGVSDYIVGARCIFPYYDFFAMRPLLASGA